MGTSAAIMEWPGRTWQPASTSSTSGTQCKPRYKCLLLDHDDTTVRGTEEVHYPAHVESLRILRPDLEPCSLQEWFEKNHDPGVSAYLGSLFSNEQMVKEQEIWRRAMMGVVPSFYVGMPELLAEFRARGGRVAVVSHSPDDVVWRAYNAQPLGDCIRPDLVLGWDDDPKKRKPAVWPALHALERLGIDPGDALVLDDLAPGVKMGKAAGITVAGAGWGHSSPTIKAYMKRECDQYFANISEFAEFLLGGNVGKVPASAL